MSAPRTQLVYDLPTRLFHWLFAGSFVTAFAIANVAEHSSAFPLHMLAGMLLGALVVLRVLWGLVGTRYARFGSFALHPARLLEYLRDVVSGKGRRWTGHNPASSWSALAMLALGAGLAITGLLMTTGDAREAYEDVHELMANSFLAMALLHVAGVVVHSSRHRDGFAQSMVDGRKRVEAEASNGVRARPFVAFALIGSLALFGAQLVKGYDPASGTLTAFGSTLQLAEPDEAGDEHGSHEAHEHENDD